MSARCPSCGKTSVNRLVGQNCPFCELRTQYVRLETTGPALSSEDLESMVTPVHQIDVEAVPALTIHGLHTLVRALNGIRRRTVYLTSGDPGIGKSTLLSQLALGCEAVLYVAGEEPREAVAERLQRLATFDTGVPIDFIYVLEGGDLEQLETVLTHPEVPPFELVIVDSIQTMYLPALESAPGSVSQVVGSTNALKRMAREHDVTMWLLAHVTKDGSVAGPKSLEHLVDVVSVFGMPEEIPERRQLTITKNRRGKLMPPVLFHLDAKTGAWRER
jgi:DNA repair protein RadA/Sms